ncbi:hypothetical protein LNKW23_43780 [Paralimibaculum aggregatum]|uniref:Uncharacterized protein n=1 Tax=Paralimibaculum aggregatum TaxID=3036245 RepID=A0ABQ6LSW4_9RHOB|nr:hypothetical protein LNKW23_43780 [Limibaculum sp. NKW23]
MVVAGAGPCLGLGLVDQAAWAKRSRRGKAAAWREPRTRAAILSQRRKGLKDMTMISMRFRGRQRFRSDPPHSRRSDTLGMTGLRRHPKRGSPASYQLPADSSHG